MVQVWSIVFSGAPIPVITEVVYGTLYGFVICHLSSVLAHFAAFLCCRRVGERLEKWQPVDTCEKKSKLSFLLDAEAPAYNAVLACLIPVLPNGVIPLVAAKTRITTGQYLLAIWGGSLPSIILCCAVGNQLVEGSWLAALLLAGALLIAVVLLWHYQTAVLSFLRRLFPALKKRIRGHI